MEWRTFRIVIVLSFMVGAGSVASGDELVWRWDFDSPEGLDVCRVSEPTKAEIRTIDGATCFCLERDLGGKTTTSSIVLNSQYFPLRSRCHYRLTCRMKVVRYELSAAPDDRGQNKSMRPPALYLYLRDSKTGTLASLGRTVGPGDCLQSSQPFLCSNLSCLRYLRRA
jgi:hypothetical protein